MKTSIKPDFFLNVPSLNKIDEATANGVTQEETALYSMSVTAGWKIFNEIAKNAVLELNNINKIAISQGLPLEEIGRNAIVVNLAQETIERLLNKVSDAVEACTNAK